MCVCTTLLPLPFLFVQAKCRAPCRQSCPPRAATSVETMYRSVTMPLRHPGKSNPYGFSHARYGVCARRYLAPLATQGPAVHEHCPFVGCRWIWLSVSRPCTVRSLCRCIPQGRVTHMGSATPGSVARAPAIFSKQRKTTRGYI